MKPMTSMKHMALTVTLLGALSACNDRIGPEAGFEIRFTRENHHSLEEFRDRPAPEVQAMAGTVRILGTFMASCSGHYPEGHGERRADVITLRISFPPVRTPEETWVCADMPEPYTYEAVFTSVQPGSYHVVVQHEGEWIVAEHNARPLAVVLDEQVHVP